MLLEVRDLAVAFRSGGGLVPAVQGTSLQLAAGGCLGVVGESGSGKSVTALAIMGLLPPATARITGGGIRFQGQDVLAMTAEERRSLRGGAMAMVFQEPMASLNPAFTIGDQIAEAVRAHAAVSTREAKARAIGLLEQVRIASPERRFDEYPHRLSGGMRQRVMIAIALAGNPQLLVADEPTTALDVTVQAQIMALLRDIRRERGAALLLISHNLGLIGGLADSIAVMYAGRVVESGPASRILHHPEHPYTIGLLGAVPRAVPGEAPLVGIEGSVPDPRHPQPGCVFRPRCPFAVALCAEQAPAMQAVAEGHAVACHQAPLA